MLLFIINILGEKLPGLGLEPWTSYIPSMLTINYPDQVQVPGYILPLSCLVL